LAIFRLQPIINIIRNKKTLNDLNNYMPEQTTQLDIQHKSNNPLPTTNPRNQLSFLIDRHFMPAYWDKEQEHPIYALCL